MSLDPLKLRSLELYARRKAVAEGGGDPNEKAVAWRQLQEMEAADPGLKDLAFKVEIAMNPSPFKGFNNPPPGPVWPSFQEAVRAVGEVFATPVADRLAHEARSMVDTPEPLAKNYKVTPLPAPAGEERLEVRWRKDGAEDKLERLVDRLRKRITGSGWEE